MNNFSAIYQIRSKINGKIYIGSSVNYRRRVNLHKHKLNHKKHHSPKLQNHVNKYGIDDLVFSIVQRVLFKNDLIKTEQAYLDLMNPAFNISKGAGGGRLGSKNSIEHRAKISKALIGNKHFLGHRHSDDSKLKIGISNFGKKRTLESRILMGKIHAGVGVGLKHLEYIKSEIKTRSQTSLAKELNIHQSTISKLLKNEK